MQTDTTQLNASLYDFWQRQTNTGQRAPLAAGEWNDQNRYLSHFGVGTEEALNYIYSGRPDFERFMDWLQQHESAEITSEALLGDVLTEADWASWRRDGYIVIKNAVPEIQCDAARAAIWEYLDADASIPESWYQAHAGKKGMMLSFFQHPALMANRNSERIRKVYEELYEGADIYLLIDKVSFNPPQTSTHKFSASPLHWDVSLQLPVPFILQGLLYLNDVSGTDGAFHCVPGFHHEIDKWLTALPPGTDPRQAALTQLKPVAIPGNAGDLVIWHNALPHCATPNLGSQPRMVQYIAYKPVHVAEQVLWK